MTLCELSIGDLAKYGSFFPGSQLSLLLQSVSEGNTFARAWIAERNGIPKVVFLWDFGNKGIYVAVGDSPSISPDALRNFVRDELSSIARRAGLKYFSVRPVSSDAVVVVQEAFKEKIAGNCIKLFYEYPVRGGKTPETIATDAELIDIDAAFFNAHYANIEKVQSEARWMWPSFDRFVDRGWGTAAIVRDEVVCWCTSEYVGHERCGIGIETIGSHRKKGIATAAAARFIWQSLSRGRIPCWECNSENTVSVHLAEKLGFEKVESTNWYYGRWE